MEGGGEEEEQVLYWEVAGGTMQELMLTRKCTSGIPLTWREKNMKGHSPFIEFRYMASEGRKTDNLG